MARGRPPLRIGQHGKITRVNLGGGVWVARCRYRDTDGITRIVQRQGPPDENDRRGKLAEDALVEAIRERRLATGADDISLDTKVCALIDQHIARLEQEGRAGRTIDTYRQDAAQLDKIGGGIRVGEASPGRVNAMLTAMSTAHGATKARRAKTLLRGGLQIAVMAGVLGTNPVRDVAQIKSKARPKGAKAIPREQLSELLGRLRESQYCIKHDLVDPITLFIATGYRRSELLGLRWVDFDPDAALMTMAGKLVRLKGKGLLWVEEGKSDDSLRTTPLPRFAIETLLARRQTPYYGEQPMIFPSTAGTWRDPDNFGKQWRQVRDELGVANVTPHSFRKTVATLIDEEGLSARVGADHLGHSKVSMTQDRYMARGKIHTQVADLLDRAVTEEKP